MSPASLVQDLWLGFRPRLRARRLAPWRPSATRLLLQLDVDQRLDDPPLAAFLESLAERLEVIAWQPRAAEDAPGREPLEDTRARAADAGRAFGDRRVVLGGYGLGAWLALAAADVPGLAAVLALAPSLAGAGAVAPRPSALRTALGEALTAAPPPLPCLVAEGADRNPAESRVVAEWLSRAPAAARLLVPGPDAALLLPPWSAAITAWADALGRA